MYTKEEAKAQHLLGWNIRCNVCGSYGAKWIAKIDGNTARPGWGSLALCMFHQIRLDEEMERHKQALSEFTAINFEQDSYFEFG